VHRSSFRSSRSRADGEQRGRELIDGNIEKAHRKKNRAWASTNETR
jgi:hypothetical protein